MTRAPPGTSSACRPWFRASQQSSAWASSCAKTYNMLSGSVLAFCVRANAKRKRNAAQHEAGMVQDFSRESLPIGSFLSLPRTPAEWRKHRLTDDLVAFYQEYGYLSGIRILTEEQIAKLRFELQGLFDPTHLGSNLFHEYHTNESPDPARVLFHALGAWRITPGFHDLLWHPAFTVPASQLLGGAVRFWHDQLFCKPAKHGGVVAWHQDYSYWTRTRPMAHLTCWIGLDDSTRENGCLHYVPGSHRWELLPITGLAVDMDAIRTVLPPHLAERFRPVPIELKKGEASF